MSGERNAVCTCSLSGDRSAQCRPTDVAKKEIKTFSANEKLRGWRGTNRTGTGKKEGKKEKSSCSRLPSSRVIGVGEVDGDSSPAAAPPLLNLCLFLSFLWVERRTVYSTSLFQVDSIIFPFRRTFGAVRAALDCRQGDFHARTAVP